MMYFNKGMLIGAAFLSINFLLSACETPSEDSSLEEPVTTEEGATEEAMTEGDGAYTDDSALPPGEGGDEGILPGSENDPSMEEVPDADSDSNAPMDNEESSDMESRSQDTLSEIVAADTSSGGSDEEMPESEDNSVIPQGLSDEPVINDLDTSVSDTYETGDESGSTDVSQAPAPEGSVVTETEAADVAMNTEIDTSSSAVSDESPISGSENSSYTVEKGDSLGTISTKLYGTKDHWKQLAAINNIDNPRALKVGQVLRTDIGKSSQADYSQGTSSEHDQVAAVTESTEKDSASVESSTDSTLSIVVERGDTLSALAHKHLGAASYWPKVWGLNKDSIKNPDLIYVGQVILFPESKDQVYTH